MLFAVLLGPAAVSAENLVCDRIALRPGPASSGSGAWSEDSSYFILVDNLGGRLLKYTRNGTFLEEIARPGLGRHEFNHPTQLFTTPGGFLLKDRVDHLIWFDSDFVPVDALDFRWSGRDPDLPRDTQYLALLDQTQVGDEFVSFGVVVRNDEQQSGFLRVSGDTLELRDVVEEVPEGSRGREWFLLGGAVVAQAAGAAYGLRWHDPPYILRLSPPHRRLETFPRDFRNLPELPPNRGPESEPARLRRVERSAVADGLYGRGRYLYLTTRKPGPAGESTWQLHQIDPQEDRLVRTLTLPTSANHIFLVPGSEYWLVIEKGQLIRFGEQDISTALVISSQWIEATGSARATADGALSCG